MKPSIAVSLLLLLCSGCQTPLAKTANAEDPLRREFLEGARPVIYKLMLGTEKTIGMSMTFLPLPAASPVLASCVFDAIQNRPKVMLRKGWEDVDVAHELMHLRMDLMEGFPVLGWRRGVERSAAVEAAFGRVQSYTQDEVVHAHLVKLGLKLDGEIIRASLFDSLYTNAARYLEEGKDRPSDGMAHIDQFGYGTLCRSAFLVQAELLLKNHRKMLPPNRVQQTERFIRLFREHRPQESLRADAVLALFRQFDVRTPSGEGEILKRWAALEGLDKFVGLSSYQKTAEGHYTLPFP